MTSNEAKWLDGWETFAVETSRSFWKEIVRRRTQETTSLAEIRKGLGAQGHDSIDASSVLDTLH